MYRARYDFKPGTVTLNGPVGLAASVAVPLR
jgi:hypothetical protein